MKSSTQSTALHVTRARAAVREEANSRVDCKGKVYPNPLQLVKRSSVMQILITLAWSEQFG
jgi:hypothetical protein